MLKREASSQDCTRLDGQSMEWPSQFWKLMKMVVVDNVSAVRPPSFASEFLIGPPDNGFVRAAHLTLGITLCGKAATLVLSVSPSGRECEFTVEAVDHLIHV